MTDDELSMECLFADCALVYRVFHLLLGKPGSPLDHEENSWSMNESYFLWLEDYFSTVISLLVNTI